MDLIRHYRRNSPLMCAIGQRIRDERRALGMTQRELAQRLGIKQPNLAAIEKGRVSPTTETLETVCRLRGRSLEWLLFGEESRVPLVSDAEEPYVTRQGAKLRLPVVARVSGKPGSGVVWDDLRPHPWHDLPAGAQLIAVRDDSLRPVASPGQKVLAVEEPARDGDLVALELKDGRRLFKRWWRRDERTVVLAGIRPDEPEAPLIETRRNIRRVWRILGVLFC